MVNLAQSEYTVEDLDRLRNEFNVVVHVELDPWGSLLVSPVDDRHEIARGELVRQANVQLGVAGHQVYPSMPWTVSSGTGYLMIPDLTVLPAGWQREGELGLDPPPLLVVEIASRSTRHVDRTRKLADYRLGRARMYLLLDLPASFEAHDLTTGKVVKAAGQIDLVVGGQPIRFSLPITPP
jgi:Uma2 family endonuclease